MAELVDESGVDNEEESTVPSEESEETEASLLEIKHLLLGNLRSGSIFVSLGETFRREGRNEK